MSKIEIRELSLTFYRGSESFLALDNIHLNIEEGEFVCILGPSGCGKSTLLSTLEGLSRPPQKGGVYIDGKKVTGPGPTRAVVFQDYSLFPWLTAADNVVFAITQIDKKAGKKEKRDKALRYLSKVGLQDFADKYPHELSGGMKQRVAIARALAVDPEILLMDEPFGAIDPKNRILLQDLLLDLWDSDEKKKTVVFVTHDIDEAILMADRIVFMTPKVISADLRANFPRPRNRDHLYHSDAYIVFRKQLVSMFYTDIQDKIGNEEVVL